MNKPEKILQQKCIALFRHCSVGTNHLICAVNNNTIARDKVDAYKQDNAKKSVGSLKGFPDVIVTLENATVLFLEFKSPKGHLTKEQRDIQHRLIGDGHFYYEIRSEADFVNAIKLHTATKITLNQL